MVDDDISVFFFCGRENWIHSLSEVGSTQPWSGLCYNMKHGVGRKVIGGRKGLPPDWDTLRIRVNINALYLLPCVCYFFFDMPSSVHPKYFRRKKLQFLFIYFYLGDATRSS